MVDISSSGMFFLQCVSYQLKLTLTFCSNQSNDSRQDVTIQCFYRVHILLSFLQHRLIFKVVPIRFEQVSQQAFSFIKTRMNVVSVFLSSLLISASFSFDNKVLTFIREDVLAALDRVDPTCRPFPSKRLPKLSIFLSRYQYRNLVCSSYSSSQDSS